jgi:hypothetical protein
MTNRFVSARPALFAAVLFASFAVTNTKAQCNGQCPPCKNNFTPLSGHTPVNGRPSINVYIDSTWNGANGSPDQRIVDPVNDAIAAWNAASDPNNCNGHSNIAYTLQASQNAAVADIKIFKITRIPGLCVATDASTRPLAIKLPGGILNYNSRAQMAIIFEHEFGHALGLADGYQSFPAPQPDCHASATIMQGVTNLFNCNPVSTAVLSGIDVAQANRNHYSQSSCQAAPTNQGEGISQTPCPDHGNCSGLSNIDYCSNGSDNGGCAIGTSLVPGPTGGDCCSNPTSPIVIDIDGQGFDLTDGAGGVSFDFFGNGQKIQMAWTARDSHNAWLVLDRNNNGLIEDGGELFGNVTPQSRSLLANGFAALAEFDKPENGGNGDGVINRQDAIYASLRLWQDTNHNGISEATELHPLEEMGVASISLEYKMSKWTDLFGNQFRYRALIGFIGPYRSSRWAYDVFLTRAK